jgi:hypothetical protein
MNNLPAELFLLLYLLFLQSTLLRTCQHVKLAAEHLQRQRQPLLVRLKSRSINDVVIEDSLRDAINHRADCNGWSTPVFGASTGETLGLGLNSSSCLPDL